jgi:glycosyltransferase
LKISIITAVRNRADTIAQAIESVRGQSHRDIEHWIIDGASNDGTLEIVLSCLDERGKWVSEPDRGIYDALNKGLARASGEVIGLVHSDDFLADEGVLESVAAAFAEPTIEAVYGDLDYVAKEDIGRVIRHWRAGEYSPTKLAWGWMPPHPALFLRRSVIERWGGFDTRFRIAADYDAILRYFNRGTLRAAYLPRVLVKMRVGGESNRSLTRIVRKSLEDYQALRRNGVGGLGALAWKNLSKLGQFF